MAMLQPLFGAAPPDWTHAVPHRPTRGSPPLHSRFQPGVSGNPLGRRKGSKNFATLVREELNKTVTATAEGRTVKMTKREAIAKRLINEALKGDLKAIEATLRYAGEEAARPDVLPPMDADAAGDRQILEAYLRRLDEGGGHAGTA